MKASKKGSQKDPWSDYRSAQKALHTIASLKRATSFRNRKKRTVRLGISSLEWDELHFARAKGDKKKRRVARTAAVLQNGG
jgi:hypothetical protein